MLLLLAAALFFKAISKSFLDDFEIALIFLSINSF